MFKPQTATNYATAGNYNDASHVKVPHPASAGVYIVPVWGTYGYQSLTGERVGRGPSPTGYFDFGSAYGSCGVLVPTANPTIRENFEAVPQVSSGTPYVRSACM